MNITKRKIRQGQIWVRVWSKNEREEYIITQTDASTFSLISLRNGNRYCTPRRLTNIKYNGTNGFEIDFEDFKMMCYSNGYSEDTCTWVFGAEQVQVRPESELS